MGFKKFSLLVIARTGLLFISILVMVLLTQQPGYLVTTGVVGLLVLAQLISLFRYISKTNAEISRFFEAVKYEDFGQRFQMGELGSGFEELGKTFTEILNKISDKRAKQAESANRFKAIIEHVPVPLISLHKDGKVTFWNNSARRLFGTNQLTKISDFKQFGDDFHHLLTTTPSGERRLVKLHTDGVEHQLAISLSEIFYGGQAEKLICLQDIGNELDTTQFQAWQDLVRVLTHEITNSITPIASLANTAADLLEEEQASAAGNNSEELSDATNAVKTVARRSQGLMDFVNSYRMITRLPSPQKKPIALTNLLQRIELLFKESLSEQVNLTINISPTNLELHADPQMLEQLLLNLLQNAKQAIANTSEPEVAINAFLNRRSQICLQVNDNGSGISNDIKDKVFVPFFTTKQQGSGVGLALARQIMLVHGGSIKLDEVEQGTQFTLVFP